MCRAIAENQPLVSPRIRQGGRVCHKKFSIKGIVQRILRGVKTTVS